MGAGVSLLGNDSLRSLFFTVINNVINDRVFLEREFCNKFFLLNAAIGRGSRSIQLLI